MSDEKRVQLLHARLKVLDTERAKIKAQLDELMLKHIEAERVEAAGEGDAKFFADMTKARLMQILEQHWSIHHMAAIQHYENVTKAEMVNLVLAAKGLEGHLEEPEKKPRKATGGGTRRHVWRS